VLWILSLKNWLSKNVLRMTNDVLQSLLDLPLSILESLQDVPSPSALPLVDERDSQAELMAAKRRKLRDLKIPIPLNPARRLAAEQDPEKWLRTYFGEWFSEDFTQDRLDMLNSIIAAAMYGGDQAIAGPRGEGKTSLAMHGALYLMCRGLCDFPVVIGKSQGKSQLELKDIKEKLQQSETFRDDYPEIARPLAATSCQIVGRTRLSQQAAGRSFTVLASTGRFVVLSSAGDVRS
jgi:hypothetical protein